MLNFTFDFELLSPVHIVDTPHHSSETAKHIESIKVVTSLLTRYKYQLEEVLYVYYYFRYALNTFIVSMIILLNRLNVLPSSRTSRGYIEGLPLRVHGSIPTQNTVSKVTHRSELSS